MLYEVYFIHKINLFDTIYNCKRQKLDGIEEPQLVIK